MTDLEKAREKSIKEEPLLTFFATGQPTIGAYSQDSLRNQFEAGAEWKEQQMIDKACEYLKNYRRDIDGTGYISGIVDDETIEDFKNYMKGE